MENITCTIERVLYSNPDNGYSVFKVSDDMTTFTVRGIFGGVDTGTTIECSGGWEENKYGRQFSVVSWMEKMPTTIAGMEGYLGSGMVSGIGPTMARRIVAHFGMDTYHIIDRKPQRLLEVEGIGRDRMRRIRESWDTHKAVRNVMTFLQGYGISPTYAIKIYKEYKNKSIEKVRENPYCLADDIFGIGFKSADKIAMSLGHKKENLTRCKAGVLYTLNTLADSGHCYAERMSLIRESGTLLEVEERYITEAVTSLVFEQALVEEGENYFLPKYFYSEKGVSGRIKKLLRHNDTLMMQVDIAAISKETGIEYDDVQEDAIMTAVRSKVMVLTGLPGTGKTTVVKGIITAFKDKTVLCAAPTGRAAKRMSESTGREAMTIHRMLEYKPKTGFTVNEKNPLKGDVLIVDESSMIDIMLMNSLVKAVPDKMRLILVGDIDQLPSVGAGNVLRDIIDSGVVPVVRLTRIFRQALTSRIVTNAHRINRGEMPDMSNGKDADFFFISQTDAEQAARDIVEIVRDRIPKAYGYSVNDIQVLTPMKNGAVGTVNLNIILQEAINPNGFSIQSGRYKYRCGDRVMQIKNNYDKNVFNGDVGVVKDINAEDGVLTAVFDKEVVEYKKEDMGELTLAYACTIHKSQGSEYPVVVMPIMMSHYIMLQRNLVYTGVTRAKKICILIGDKKAVGMAVHNQVVTERNTRLKERLNEQ